jgi:hypothetical protein
MLGTSVPCAKACKTDLNCLGLILSNVSFHFSTNLSLALCNRTYMVASKRILPSYKSILGELLPLHKLPLWVTWVTTPGTHVPQFIDWVDQCRLLFTVVYFESILHDQHKSVTFTMLEIFQCSSAWIFWRPILWRPVPLATHVQTYAGHTDLQGLSRI